MSEGADNRIVLAVANGRLGKRILYASDDADGVWRAESTGGHYAKPSDYLGAGKDANAHYKTFTFHIVDDVDDLRKLYTLRKKLTDYVQTSIILGHPTQAMMDAVIATEVDEETGLTHHITKKIARSKKYLQDSPSNIMTFDIDNLDLSGRGYDAIANNGETPDILFEVFDNIGLDWLITDCVIHFSSSHGLTNRSNVKTHISFQTAEPLSLAQQKRVAEYVNEKASVAGVSESLVDAAVYESRRILFTAPAEIFKRVQGGGEATRTEHIMPRPFWRVRLLEMGDGPLEVPPEALAYVTKDRALRELTGYEGETFDTDIRPGNVYGPIRNRIYAAAISTPEGYEEGAKAHLAAELRHLVAQLPDNAEKGESRQRYVSDEEISRQWDGAVKHYQERNYRYTDGAKKDTSAESVARARKRIGDLIGEAIKSGVEYADKLASQDQFMPPPPTHTLILSPPGIGKTEAVVRGVKDEYIEEYRIAHLSPTAKLSEETRGRMLQAHDDEEHVKLYLGREKICEADDETQELARQVETLGLSPLKLVCSVCPLHDSCAWPAQRRDKEPGFIAAQHANISSTYVNVSKEQAPATVIFDEEIMSQIVPEATTMTADRVNKSIKHARVVRANGKTNNYATADLQKSRRDFMNIITSYDGPVPTSAFGNLTKRYNKNNVSVLSLMIHEEEEVQRIWRERVEALVEEVREGGRSKKKDKDLKEAGWQLRNCKVFLEIYHIVKTSTDMLNRKVVFGITHVEGTIVFNHRRPLPPSMADKNGIHLDGTADPDVFKAYMRGDGLSRTKLEIEEINVVPEHYHLTQFADRPYGRTFFARNNAQGERDDSNIMQLYLFIRSEARKRKDVLVISQKAVKEMLLEMAEKHGSIDNAHFHHFGDIRGLDQFKDVECGIIVGRAAPSNAALEMLTAALYYDDESVEEVEGTKDFHSEEKTLHMRDGRGVVIKAESHPDSRVRAVRRQVVDAEVKQAILRLRLFDRTADNPAQLFVFGQTDTGLLIDKISSWKDAKRTRADDAVEHYHVASTSMYMCDLIAEKDGDGRTAHAIRDAMRERIKLLDWPTYKFRVYNKLTQAKVNAATIEDATLMLSKFGDVRDVRKC